MEPPAPVCSHRQLTSKHLKVAEKSAKLTYRLLPNRLTDFLQTHNYFRSIPPTGTKRRPLT
uniref:Uncharacterized protein n=1 Tax=Anguilla anguilla TaxID=7936 RepID=A0A0E9RYV9_ANGAN